MNEVAEKIPLVEEPSMFKKYAKDVTYWIAIFTAAISNVFLDKTESQSTDTDHEKRLVQVEKRVTSHTEILTEHGDMLSSQHTVIEVMGSNVKNIEIRLANQGLKLNSIDGKTDQILFLLAGNSRND